MFFSHYFNSAVSFGIHFSLLPIKNPKSSIENVRKTESDDESSFPSLFPWTSPSHHPPIKVSADRANAC